ncbi:hypothetical protein ASE04_28610 [Rhizobium sp. Root708]|uniref:hypothetical protein n=1 Tax=Rhizobium sp. Root708 TaxID=1736592 RepID=UPI0006FF49A8|nr:hypothetical protein [Rhizobium sp. Root708]KRB57066.1 hypothetical protein ASE04_28610 [Rhizobium sp. Root708]
MRISTLASMAMLSLAAAAGPLAFAGFDTVAMANNGNGGRNGGGGSHGSSGSHGNSGGSHGNSGAQSGSSGSTHGNSIQSGGASKGKSSEAGKTSQSGRNGKPATVAKEKKASAELAGLNSLNRSYKAYLHTSDPKMTAISVYAIAYAQYELESGTEPSADDPLLGEEALEEALTSATKTGAISPAALDKAKSILGVGDAEGKIDQIRATLTPITPVEPTDPISPTDPVTSTEPPVSDEQRL